MRRLLLLVGIALIALGGYLHWRVHRQTSGALARSVVAVSVPHREEAERWRLAGSAAIALGTLTAGLGLLRRRG